MAREIDRRVLAMTTAQKSEPREPLTLAGLRKVIESFEYALLTSNPLVRGDDCLKMGRNEFMPPGCRYMLIVAPQKLEAVAKLFGARISSRVGDGKTYEFFLPPR